MNTTAKTAFSGEDIAIVGLSVNVPGAADVEAYWANLRDGVESIRRLSEQELLDAGESPEVLARKNYVPAAAVLEGFDTFDADFFGFSPKDAAILDPQHRKFLEVAWEAMEQAGHPPETMAGPIGVYAGCGMGSYFYFNICSNPDLVDDVGMFLLRHTGNDKDFLSTRVSHVFDLKGPSINLQTACSTSLVAIHYACQALRAGEVDMALAGGVTIELPQGRGYEFKENEILSPDGHCHAFDHRAQGTVFGSGAGAVALRRLSDAVADGDHIWAVIKGSAVNNDGAAKAGYLAPSVDGQTQAIAAALDAAGVAAQSIGMVECHGTGTYLGDPIEVAALTEAYRAETAAVDFCRLGSVKTNIGHLDTAAGVAGLAKATLALHNKQIPPSLGYEAPNPAIPFDGSPFRVNASLTDWAVGDTPRRAAINALGVGGTNAHMILQEAPEAAASEESDWPFHALVISGASKAALDANTAALAAHLRSHPDQPLADVAHTLKQGRRAFEKRRVVVAETHTEAAELLESADTRRVFTHEALGENPEVVFMFPGGGAQYAGMARDLYETEPEFAEWMDRGLNHLSPQLDYDIRALWLPEADETDAASERLKQPSVQLPLIAIVEYALAKLWMSWGVQPAAMVGHSMGENVAACLAGVMRFEDLIDLVLLRGRLFDEVPAGGMLSISAPLSAIEPLLGDDLDIASINAPELIAVSGPQAALDAMQDRLSKADIDYQRIAIDIAAHSRMLEPILARYHAFLADLDLQAPTMPFISNRTGAPITVQEATSPDYWVAQLRNTVNFADCITTLSAPRQRIYLEVGPGKALSALAQMHPEVGAAQVLSTLRHPDQDIADDKYFISVIGRLWACGLEADWSQIWGEAKRNRVVLPTYQFQRARYFIEPGQTALAAPIAPLTRSDVIEDWGSVPAWRPRFADTDMDVATDLGDVGLTWVMFADDAGRAAPAVQRLRDAGHRVITVRAGDAFARTDDTTYTLAPEQGRQGYDQLIAALKERDLMPDRIGHFWLTDDHLPPRAGSSLFDRNLEQGFWSLTWLAQALSDAGLDKPLHLSAFTTGAALVRGEAVPHPEAALIAGPVGVFAREMPGVTCAQIDIDPRAEQAVVSKGWFSKPVEATPDEGLTERLLEELMATPANTVAALRGAKRFEQSYRDIKLPATETPVFRDDGTYLITGGFGGIGLTLAADILGQHKATVVLLSHGPMPARQAWDGYLKTHATTDRTARRIHAVMRLEELAKPLGGSIEVAQADVANLAQMRRVTQDLTARYGGLTGVIHAAGTLDDAPLLAKTDASIEAVLSPKVQGLRVLDQLLPDGTLELMVLFSSTSTATRSAGQTDYVAANAWLNAFAAARRGAKTRVVAINWGIWADVGMAAKALSGAASDVLPPRRLEAAFLETAGADAVGDMVFTAPFTTENWMLDQHRTAEGQAILPGTGYIELLAEAASAQGMTGFDIQDLYFLRAMPVEADTRREMQITLRPEGGGYAAEMRSDCTHMGKDGWQLHAQATVTPLSKAVPETVDLAGLAARCTTVEQGTHESRLKSPQEAHLNFGPNWHVLSETRMGTAEGVAKLSLPSGLQTTENAPILHPGLMDLATGWAIGLVPGYGATHLWVPVSYGAIHVHAALPAELYSWVRLREGQGDFARFDVTLCDGAGRVLVEVSDFAMKRLEGGLTAMPLTAAEIRFADEDDGEGTRSPAEEQLAYLVSQGIRASEGPDALRRAIALDRSQIMVSSLPLQGLIERANTPVSDSAVSGQSFERPDLDGSFVAPRNGIEEKLAELWSNLLGVSPVGVEDSFFDLGGHSLIAVRLFAAVKREFKVEFPISVLFEAPTIAKCAALIAAQTGDLGEISSGEAPAAAPEKYEFLVPLNQSEQRDAPPLFIVAGMFGNVLNLRHLALPFASERRVFGVQARGLIGDSEPHRDVGAAARDYLAEMQRLQPEGPYLIAGYSGGGIMAYEMAQQLRDAGHAVGVLAMFDTPLPVRPPLSKPDKALIKLAELKTKGPGYLVEWAQNRWAWEMRKRKGEAVSDVPAGAEFNNLKIQNAFLEAVGKYRTPDWDGPLTLFRPALDLHWPVTGGRFVSKEREYVFEDNDWRHYATHLEVIEVPGDHDSMMLAPNVTTLAQELREVIGRALEEGADDWQQATAAQ
ncbi:KR domain-containing protein [Sulfitobacter sp. M57]|uniref:type I polyketide synthase n=1 Tax=unclassified Sulfitobacter TaxID=196795 RepID=UPI0023E0EBF9|nr:MULTISPECIES: type I polyketide synthase [unclassified Sulfitobacter]MDF3414227.1 KR domain-containing protein [Sulfitobacter sp. KE5]MDF3420491.1 KR domain-containing protein [Sulfitobacter sp. KE43]MDF3432773.1 KR domain-containing protein [Sulfitobacter sp. KE42]MDF3458413.1 KR domain-containing protein [Sulfitobacter sp. S74]MDF3462313.1 KR domain-containing protein [Sulfitobacter sp. Ks18]